MNYASSFLSESPLRTCPACGTTENRGQAQFCMACGRELKDLAYLPADSLRASYHMQQPGNISISGQKLETKGQRPIAAKVPQTNSNGASATALAFVTYALVPYLGILFCPGAVLMGGVGLIRSWRVPRVGGRRASYAGVIFGIVIFGAQVFLWWILYKVPKWAAGIEF